MQGKTTIPGMVREVPSAPGGWSDIVTADAGPLVTSEFLDLPFILLDDARGGGEALLLRHPIETISAHRFEDVPAALERARGAVDRGLHVAGYLGYEAGAGFQPRLREFMTLPKDGSPLLWLGAFKKIEQVDGEKSFLQNIQTEPLFYHPNVDRQAYEAAFTSVQEYINAGDVYQVNLTFPNAVPFNTHPLASYDAFRDAQRAGWGSVVFTGERWILSFSPEMFFTLEDGRLWAKPMKGTARRCQTTEEDSQACADLHASVKNRAENLMIVDLMRNDLSQVSEAGSVRVDALYTIETYPTVHQMTSTISARLRGGADAFAVLERTFPCGSVTGAPKFRAMEIIAELEQAARGIYTGSIGLVTRNGDAAFNVAIRTVECGVDAKVARLGLGSGVVADSNALDEWEECLAKGRFLGTPAA